MPHVVQREHEKEASAEDWGRIALVHVPSQIALVDRQHRYVWVNSAGTASSLALHTRVEDSIPLDDRDRVHHAIERAFETCEASYYEARTEALSAKAWVGTRIIPVEHGNAERPLVLLVSDDVTRQREGEQALHESEARFEDFAEASPDLMTVVDSDLRIEYVNRNPLSSLARPEEVEGGSLGDLMVPEDRERATAVILGVLETGEPGEYTARCITGTTCLCRVRRLGSGGEKRRALIVGTDISEQRAAEAERNELAERLRQGQKLETIGQLAGAVAHDFNNLVLMIQADLHFAQEAVLRGENPMPDLDSIRKILSRATDLSQRLLTIGRKEPHNPKLTHLDDFVNATLKLLRRVIPESIRIESSFGVCNAKVLVDVSQLERVLINLCVNARDAIGDETGTITISVERRTLPPGLSVGDLDSSYLALSVSDTGQGMDAGTLARAFEPFFTTKPLDKGSGLGLSMVHSVIKRHGGFVDVKSEPGQGTRFTLLLPEIAGPLVSTPVPQLAAPSSGDGQTILLAEDEPAVRRIVTRILSRAGYHVLAAADGQEAVLLLEQHRERVSAVILDAVMPNLGGKDAYEQMRKLCPQLPVLFSSGYSADSLPESLLEASGVSVLAKPFEPRTLLTALSDLLKASASTTRAEDNAPGRHAQLS